jgi:hypothetical protein
LASQHYCHSEHPTYALILRIPQIMPIFSKIKIFWGINAVEEFLYLQLFIPGSVVHFWSLQDVKYP